jgi:uncharacterized cupin superfamily protein
MASDQNIRTTDWEREFPGVHGTRIGARAGSRELGCALFELDPGGQAVPYHLHHGNEELLIVLEGTPELRTPDGTRTLEPGAVVAFPAGPEGAHRVRNASGAPCRYLMVSTKRFPDVAVQIDTGTILAMAGEGPDAGWAFPKGADASYMDLTMEAIRRDTAGGA